MNILYHHRTQGTGAEGVHIAHIIQGLRDAGHQVDVVCPHNNDPLKTAGNNPYTQRKGFKSRFMAVLSRRLPQFLFELMEMFYNHYAAKKLHRALKRCPVDLIYERQAFFLTAGAKVAYKYQIPYFVEVNELAGHKRVRKQVFVEQARRAEKIVFDQAQAIIVVSAFLKAEIVAMGIDETKIHVIANGVDEKQFVPHPKEQNLLDQLSIQDQVVIGFIGWFVPWHNLQLLLKAFAKVGSKRAVLLWIGDGPLKSELRELAEQLGIGDQLLMPGAVTYNQIPQYIQLMDVCVIPGSNTYRSPIKLFEYMVMGKAVIAPAHQPIVSVVDNQVDGLIFKADDCDELEKALAVLIKDETLRQSLGAAARDKVLKGYLWSHNAERVIHIFQSLKKETK